MTSEESLRPFVAAGVRDLGGVVDEPDVRTLELLIPDVLREALGAEYLRLDTESQPLSIGSPVIEAVANALSSGGCVARAYLNPIYLQGGDLQSKWDRAFQLNAGRAALLSQSLEETIHAVFHFRASFLTDEREERLYPVAINLTTGISYDNLINDWPRIFLDEAASYNGLPTAQAAELEGLKIAIERALQARIAPDIDAARRTQEKFLARELRRLEDYYAALDAELAERERRPSTEALAARLLERRRALGLDRAKKTRDAVEKHRLRIETKAVAVLLIHQPWLRVAMRLENRRETLDRPFFWNPALKSFAPIACDACGGQTSAFSLRDARLLCPSCGSGTSPGLSASPAP